MCDNVVSWTHNHALALRETLHFPEEVICEIEKNLIFEHNYLIPLTINNNIDECKNYSYQVQLNGNINYEYSLTLIYENTLSIYFGYCSRYTY